MRIIVVDPVTGYELAWEDVTTTQTDGFPPGTFLDYAVFTYRWTSTLPG